jgi:hypothetical protein
MNKKLFLGFGNAKLSKRIATLSLPAGYSCPFAKECLSKADKITGKITDGEHCRFRCFSASQEACFSEVRKSRWNNFDILRKTRTVEETVNVIMDSIPFGVDIMRVHVSGDFFREKYFLAWLNIALNNKQSIFYGYTKAIPFLVKYKEYIPSNFRFTASKGGLHDSLIAKHRLKFSEVVFSVKEADQKGLQIDHDDSLAFAGNKSFALLIHGTQPVGSEANEAWQALKYSGESGYGKTPVSNGTSFKIHITIQKGKVIIPDNQPRYKFLRTMSYV